MTFDDAKKVMAGLGQDHVLAGWERLDAKAQAGLLEQIEALDVETVDRILKLLREKHAGAGGVHTDIEPAAVVSLSSAEQGETCAVGERALREGKVGVILVAGGQGTRLGYDGPKGTYSLGPISGASLFEIHARKLLALERQFGAQIPFYVMTSQGNDADTRRFFQDNEFFGLTPERVKFFVQGTLPAFWPDGRMVLEAPGRLFSAPDGHGGILTALKRTGMIDDMERRGLTTLYYFQVDNPLVEIADTVFVGLHLQKTADMSLKVCAKRNPSEGLGVVVVRDGRQAVVEYTELTDAQKEARRPDGELVFKFGSVAIHIFSLAFLKQEATAGLPLHQAHKKVSYCDETGKTCKPEKPNAYKFEKFIFDALPDAKTALLLEFAREDEFAPVKNAEGDDSPATARAAMMEKWARWMAAIGVSVPRDAKGGLVYKMEIDPVFANGVKELKAKLSKGLEIKGDVALRG
jgi:UDP-N-acetylglucosamine/UDP-N-acetylgalactosamine diphosphorylase